MTQPKISKKKPVEWVLKIDSNNMIPVTQEIKEFRDYIRKLCVKLVPVKR